MGTKRLTNPYRSVAQGLGIAALIGSFFPGCMFGVPRIFIYFKFILNALFKCHIVVIPLFFSAYELSLSYLKKRSASS